MKKLITVVFLFASVSIANAGTKITQKIGNFDYTTNQDGSTDVTQHIGNFSYTTESDGDTYQSQKIGDFTYETGNDEKKDCDKDDHNRSGMYQEYPYDSDRQKFIGSLFGCHRGASDYWGDLFFCEKQVNDFDKCPKCGISFVGDKIPKKDREKYGGAKNFTRKIGIYSRERDMTISWRCPDCMYEWPVYEKKPTENLQVSEKK